MPLSKGLEVVWTLAHHEHYNFGLAFQLLRKLTVKVGSEAEDVR